MKILFGVSMFTDRGDYHIGADRPEDGIFSASELVLRLELAADDAELSDEQHMIAGGFQAVFRTLPGSFAGNQIQHRFGKADNRVYHELVFYEGPERKFAFDETLITVAGGCVEVLGKEDVPSDVLPEIEHKDRNISLAWQELSLNYPDHAVSYD